MLRRPLALRCGACPVPARHPAPPDVRTIPKDLESPHAPRPLFAPRHPRPHPLGEEHFHCAPGPSGWRYVSQTITPSGDHSGSVDLAIDELGRPIRLELNAASWQVRGAAIDGVTWVRTDPTGTHATEGNAPAHAFTGTSPAFLVATARLLRLTPASPATRVRLVRFTDPVLAPSPSTSPGPC